MMEVSELSVTQYRLYPEDSLPLRSLKTKAWITSLKDTFNFGTIGLVTQTGEIGAEAGTFTESRERALVIERILISDRRTVVTVLGSSSDADDFHSALMNLIRAEMPEVAADQPSPISCRQETSCSAKLNFHPTAMFSGAMEAFIKEELIPKASDSEADVILKGVRFGINLAYQPKKPEINAYGITLSPKVFIVEPKADRPLSDCRYDTESPTDSVTHLRLLEQLEKGLASS